MNLRCYNGNLHIVSLTLFWRVSWYNNVLQTFAASHPLATEPLKQRCSTVNIDTTLFSDSQVHQHRHDVLAKVCARSTGYRLGGLSLPRKSVVRLTDRPDMTLDVYRGRKTTIQPTNQPTRRFPILSLIVAVLLLDVHGNVGTVS